MILTRNRHIREKNQEGIWHGYKLKKKKTLQKVGDGD